MKLFGIVFLSLSIVATTCRAQRRQPNTIAEVLDGLFSTSTLFSLATLDDESLATVAERLTSDKPTTLFAPSNDAFAALGPDVISFLSENLDVLAAVLEYHVVEGVIRTSDITRTPRSIPTLQGQSVVAVNTRNGVVLNPQADPDDDTRVIQPDLFASTNGIIHVIDKVLVFPGIEELIPLLAPPEIVDIVQGLGLGALVEAVDAVGLTGVFNPGPPALTTVFAPPEDKLLSALSRYEPFIFRDILELHVIPRISIPAENLLDPESVPGSVELDFVQNGPNIQIQAPGSVATIIAPNLEASNGILHLIDEVLLPAPYPGITIPGVEGPFPLGIFGPFTLFEPTVEAFLDLPPNLLEFLLTPEGSQTLVTILSYHVLPQIVPSDNLTNGSEFSTALGSTLSIRRIGDAILIQDATPDFAVVTDPDNFFLETIVHAISKVLIPPNIFETATAIGDLTVFVDAVEFVALDTIINRPGNVPSFTVFTPTNQAFANLPADAQAFLFSEQGRESLRNILEYHVVANQVITAQDINLGLSVTTAQGEDISFIVAGRTILIQDSTDDFAQVVVPNVFALNGVLHIIDKVLIPEDFLDVASASPSVAPITKPPSKPPLTFPPISGVPPIGPTPVTFPVPDLVETAVATDNLSTLVEAVSAAGLVDVLSGDGPFTVFAPTNEAFAAIDEEVLQALLADTESLTSILTYHVVAGKILAEDVTEGAVVATVNGQSLKFSLRPKFFLVASTILIEDSTDIPAQVLVEDVLASNGVVHVIDKVLIPSP